MPSHPYTVIDQLRSASRLMVRELGFMRSTLAATDYPPSAVHALVEIGERGTLTGGELAQLLGLEKSSVSRLLRKLVEAGEIEEIPHPDDARSKTLRLTPSGRGTLDGIQAFARAQVGAALEHLTTEQQHRVRTGIADYAGALQAQRLGQGLPVTETAQIVAGYRPGIVGHITQMHAAYYAHKAGFGQPFESLVATGLAQLTGRLDNPRNQVWLALDGEQVLGSIAIDGEGEGGEATLRFFILDESAHGRGLGKRLLAEALAFCDQQGFVTTRLWTFKGLDVARRLYEANGFSLVQEQPGEQWGAPVIEQCFVRPSPV